MSKAFGESDARESARQIVVERLLAWKLKRAIFINYLQKNSNCLRNVHLAFESFRATFWEYLDNKILCCTKHRLTLSSLETNMVFILSPLCENANVCTFKTAKICKL